MSNFVFLSQDPKFIIENLKLTVRFKKDDLTRSEWVFRIILRSLFKNKKKKSLLYLLIKQSELDRMTIEEIIDNESHNLLIDPKYLEYIGRAFKLIDEDLYKLETHEDYEIQQLQQKKLIFPEDIKIKEQNPLNFNINGKLLREIAEINEKDIGLEIYIPRTRLIKNELYILQFRLVIKDFIPQDVLQAMKDPGTAWAFGINLHNRAENREMFSKIPARILDIQSLELWIGMPHRHLLLDSSPKYKALYWFSTWDKEKIEKLQSKYESLSRFKEFMNTIGDVWVKIVVNVKRDSCENNNDSKRVEDEFTIIGFSPWIGSELQKVARDLEPKIRDLVKKDELKESIENLKEDIEKRYISYKGALGAWGLIAAILTVALTAMMLLIRDLTGAIMYIEGVRQFTLKEIVKVSILAGITIYVVFFVMQFISKRLGISK